MIFDDAYIDQCGDAYLAETALHAVCSFEEFLLRPDYWRERLMSGQLLPRQREVQRRVDGRASGKING